MVDGAPLYLHEYLVRNRLVRIHTNPAIMLDEIRTQAQLEHLSGLENAAKSEGLGVWVQ